MGYCIERKQINTFTLQDMQIYVYRAKILELHFLVNYYSAKNKFISQFIHLSKSVQKVCLKNRLHSLYIKDQSMKENLTTHVGNISPCKFMTYHLTKKPNYLEITMFYDICMVCVNNLVYCTTITLKILY